MNFKCAIPSMLLAILLSACSQSEAPKAATPPKALKKSTPTAVVVPPPTSPVAAPPSAAAAPSAVAADVPVKEDPGIMTKMDALNLVVRDFVVQQGRPPKDLDELVTMKLIARLPEAPAGMKFVYDRQANQVKAVKK